MEVYRIQRDDLESLPVDWKIIRNRSRVDPLVSQAIRFTKIGWPDKSPSEELYPFFIRRYEFTLQDDYLLWGSRVVIPKQLREPFLDSLYEGHFGIVKMKALARQHL